MKFRNTITTTTFVCFVILTVSSCLGLIDGLAKSNIVGEWRATSITDDATKNTIPINTNITNKILGNKLGDGLVFNEDGSFGIFSQKQGNLGGKSGTYTIAVLTLTLNFNGEKPILRNIVTVGESELILRDTINNIPKTITYNK